MNCFFCKTRSNTLFAFIITLQQLNSVAQPILPKFTVSQYESESKGYYFLSPCIVGPNALANSYADLILDAKGQTVYYKSYEKGFVGGNLKLHPNGKYSYFFDRYFYILDSLFHQIDTVSCQNGLIQDHPELLILPNGNYALLGYENSTMDLSQYFIFKKNGTQGLENAKVKCGVIQELNPKKEVVFEWHSKLHYKFDDIDTFYVEKMYDIDWTHFNSLEYDLDGNYLVSSLHFKEITKVNRKTGEIMWRLGGKRNQFTFLNDSAKLGQPNQIIRLPNRYVTIYDNGNCTEKNRPEVVKEFRIDERNLTMTLIWKHANRHDKCSSNFGSAQRLPNRTTLISYGNLSPNKVIFNLVSINNHVIFEISSTDPIRTNRVANYWQLPVDLPQPQITVKAQGGQIILEAPPGHESYYWNTGEKTRTIVAKKNRSYSVCVPFGPEGYLYSKPVLTK